MAKTSTSQFSRKQVAWSTAATVAMAVFILTVAQKTESKRSHVAPTLSKPTAIPEISDKVEPKVPPPAPPDRLPGGVIPSHESLDSEAEECLDKDPLAHGFKLFKESPFFENYELRLSQFARRLAKEAPEEGISWLSSLEKSASTASAVLCFGEELAKASPEKVLKCRELLANSLRVAFDSGVAKYKMKASADDAVAYLNKCDLRPSERRLLFQQLATSIESDPVAVLEFTSKYPEYSNPRIYGNSLYAVWTKEPAKALHSLSGLPDDQFKMNAYGAFADRYAEADYVGASEWIRSLPESGAKDHAIGALAQKIKARLPREALVWANEIHSETDRNFLIKSLVTDIGSYDKEGVLQFLETARITPETRSELQKRLQQ